MMMSFRVKVVEKVLRPTLAWEPLKFILSSLFVSFMKLVLNIEGGAIITKLVYEL